MTKPAWSESELTYLQDNWPTKSIEDIALHLGRSRSAVRNKRYELQLPLSVTPWTDSEINALEDLYLNAGSVGVLRLKEFAESVGRPKSSVCRKAKLLGLETSYSRKKVDERKIRVPKFATDAERKKAKIESTQKYIAAHGHPRGMAGKSHTQETKDRLRQTSLAFRATLSSNEAGDIAAKAMQTTFAKYGRLGPQVKRGSWKAGWREIGDKRNYYRSKWEANYGRYLQWLKEQGEILDWEHEPETFWFEAIKRGVRSYLPDFRVTENDGSTLLHEVKGWMDARSKTTIKRMAKYHPQETLIVIREKQYKEIGKKVSALIEGWEP